jgi:hypothetical protein
MGTNSQGSDVTTKAREKASEYGQKAQEQADAGIDRAAGGMEKAADKLRSQALREEGVRAQAGEKVADGIDKTAEYLREHDTQAILDDVEKYVRRHPVQAIAGAVVGGFVLARVLR